MKNKFITLILVLSMSLCLSCSREIPPVFEIYVTFKNAENFNQIYLESNNLVHGTLNQITQLPSGSGTIFYNSGLKTISKANYGQKVFITSVAQNIGMNEFFSIDASLELLRDEKSFFVNVDKWNNIFPVNFNPENGEAYEVNFIIDVNNSIKKKDNSFYFELGGDSKVVITKY